MADIQIAIEGRDAVEATKELMESPGLSGTWEAPSETTREATLAAVAAIVGITAGAAAVAEQIRRWYKEWRTGKPGKSIEKAVLIVDEKRILLEGASVDDIQQILATVISEDNKRA